MSANISLDNRGVVRQWYHFEYHRGRLYIYNATDEIAYWHPAHGKTQFMREYAANWQYQQEKKMTKFKVGDTVKIINPEYDEAEYPGIHTDTFTVAEARDDSHTYPYILSPKPTGVIMNTWTDEELKLTKETDMTEFKIGTRVEITHNFRDEQLAVGTKGTVMIARQDRGIGEVYVLLDTGRGHNFYAHELKQIEKTIDDIQVGDTVIYDRDWATSEYTVGARMGEVVILLDGDGHVDSTCSIQELKDSGNFSLPEVEEPEVELTVAQIAEKLGHKVKVVEG